MILGAEGVPVHVVGQQTKAHLAELNIIGGQIHPDHQILVLAKGSGGHDVPDDLGVVLEGVTTENGAGKGQRRGAVDALSLHDLGQNILNGGIFGRAVEATHGKLGSGTLEIFDTARESIGVQQLFFMDPFAVQPSVGASGDSDHIARGVKFGSDQEELALLGGVHPTAVGNTPGIPDRFVRTEELNGLRDQVGEVIRKLGGYDQVIL